MPYKTYQIKIEQKEIIIEIDKISKKELRRTFPIRFHVKGTMELFKQMLQDFDWNKKTEKHFNDILDQYAKLSLYNFLKIQRYPLVKTKKIFINPKENDKNAKN